MTVTILAFGIVKEIFGGASLTIELENASVDALKAQLETQFPRLKQLASYMVAVNNDYAVAGQVIGERDEIAIIPPVSGG